MYNITEGWLVSSVSINDTETLQISNVTVSLPTPREERREGLLSDATTHVFLLAVEVGILPALVLAGVTMNVMNMVVFLRQGLSDRINLCLFSLAISDTAYILTLLITRLHNIFKLFDPLLGQYWQFQSLNLIGVYAGFMNVSNCLTLLISLERCLLVVNPLKARTMLSTRTMAVIIIITFVVCLSYLLPRVFRFEVVTFTDVKTNVTRYKLQPTRFFMNNEQIINAISGVMNIALLSFAFVGVAIATLIISVRMRDVLAWRQKSASITTSAERAEASVTRMLFVICVMFIVCYVPAVIRNVVNFVVPEFQPGMRYQNIMYVSISFMHTLGSINSSFNFVVYFVMSTRFRHTFKEMFSPPNVQRTKRVEIEHKGTE